MKRLFVSELKNKLSENPRFIQVILGPRQVGKTTGVLQLKEELKKTYFIYHSADEVFGRGQEWLQDCWLKARVEKVQHQELVLIIDEIQNIPDWSKIVKGLWDQDKINKKQFHVILLGSSALELHQGLSESLLGRFEKTYVPHWSFHESKKLVPQLSLDEYLRYGGYPEPLHIEDDKRRTLYVRQSILEPIITQDILQNATVKKPALFRQAFELACLHGGEVLSLNKFLGQLQEGGNVDLVKHYLSLYEQSFLLNTLDKFSTNRVQKKGSSPKLIPRAPVFLNLFREFDRGRSFEVMVGNELLDKFEHVTYWREANHEVDYVIKIGKRIIGIEVKSGAKRDAKGLDEFCKRFKAQRLLITEDNYHQIDQLLAALS